MFDPRPDVLDLIERADFRSHFAPSDDAEWSDLSTEPMEDDCDEIDL